MSIVHSTPGLLDIRAITTFGLHAKPGSTTPIGKFGTGLKYAIATLLRLGCRIQLFIGDVEYEFYTKKSDFRGSEFEQVYMKKRRGILSKWQSVELPFTIDHGKFWVAWQAFRELHSNTLDEGGETYSVDKGTDGLYTSDRTIFVITGEAYEKAYHDRDEIFLPESLTKREGNETVQVFNNPSNYLYWRGIRVMDLEKPSVYTYNLLSDLELTEDRTLKYMFQAQSLIAGYVATSADEKLINSVVSADAEKHFEGRLDWDYSGKTPSSVFQDIVDKKKRRGRYVSPRALLFHDRYYAAEIPAAEETLRDKIERFSYNNNVPYDLRMLLKYLLTCEITEPVEDEDLPF